MAERHLGKMEVESPILSSGSKLTKFFAFLSSVRSGFAGVFGMHACPSIASREGGEL